MKNIVPALVLSFSLAATAAFAGEACKFPGHQVSENDMTGIEVMIMPKAGSELAEALKGKTRPGVVLKERFAVTGLDFDADFGRWSPMSGFATAYICPADGQSKEEALAKLKDGEDVQSVSPNYRIYIN